MCCKVIDVVGWIQVDVVLYHHLISSSSSPITEKIGEEVER